MSMTMDFAKQFVRLRAAPRRLLLLGLLSCLLVGCRDRRESAAASPVRVNQTPEQVEREIHGRVNAYRRSRGLAPLAMDHTMNTLAREHSRWMASRGKLTHRGSDRRFRKLQSEPTHLKSFAENVAFNWNHPNPGEVAVDGWIKSPGHHRNILRRDDQVTGVGVARAKDGSWYFTQLFGLRR